MVDSHFPIQRVYLASRSPRRRELLTQVGVGFETLAFRGPPREDAALDETPCDEELAAEYVQRLAGNKAEHGWQIVRRRGLLRQPVLAADTIVELAGELIGKPRDAEHAVRILSGLSGCTHRVLTAVAVTFEGRSDSVLSISEVRFRTLEMQEIRHYVACGEPMDKAGAYGIQGRAGSFVEYLAGSYTGIMGLPLCQTVQLLKGFGYRI